MELNLAIGSYRYIAIEDSYCVISSEWSDPNYLDVLNSIKSYDRLLHQSLDKIFRERCLSNSDQIKQFLRGPQLKSIIKPTLDQEPVLSRQLPNGEFRELSLLWIAVLAGYADSAELLVRSGADVSELFGRRDPQVIDEKWTILHVLIKMDPSTENERLIRLVIDHGADLQARDSRGQTVLLHAVAEERVQMTEMLLEIGADVNAADDEGMTPLLVAASNIMANERVPLLMKHGADVLAKSRNGQNALHLLAYNRCEHSVDLVSVLIEKGVSLDDKEHLNHHQPIHRATEMRKIELVELYLDHGADVNALTKKGESPLYIAAQHCIKEMTKALLKRGANVHLKTIEGSTALHHYCKSAASPTMFFYSDTLEANIGLLLSAGADVLAVDNNGKTPFALISSGDNVENDEEQPGTRLLIKELALKKGCQPSIELMDERIIERHSNLRDYYRECIEEIEKMKDAGFFGTCTFFQLLAKCQCQIAALMRNPEFETKFKQCDLSGFHYADDVRRAFERARDHYESLVQQEAVIDEAVYGILPYMIVRKVAHYTFDCCDNNVK